MGVIGYMIEDKAITFASSMLERQKQLEILEITEQCKIEIQQILDKYSCRIEVSMTIKAAGNIPQIAIVRKS